MGVALNMNQNTLSWKDWNQSHVFNDKILFSNNCTFDLLILVHLW